MLLPIILAAGAFLLSANIAGVGAQALTADQQLCIQNCTNAAANATGCTDIQANQTCVCASPLFSPAVVNCVTGNKACGNFPADFVKGNVASGCASVSASAHLASATAAANLGSVTASAPSQPSQSNKPGSAIALNRRVGLAAVSVAGLTVASLLV